MSAVDEESLKMLTKRLGKLVLEGKSERKDKKLKGLLVHLKTEVLRNDKAATSFRESHGLHFLYNIIEYHRSVRESILAVTCSLLANLTTLDNATKQHVCLRRNLDFLVEILEQTHSTDVINCASRLLGNVVADLGLEEDPSLSSRVSKAIVRQLSYVVEANCRQSLLRTVRHLVVIPDCKAKLLRLDVVPCICQFLEANHEEVTNATFQCLETLHINDTEVVMQLARVSQFPLFVKGTTSSDSATARTAVNILLACGRLPEYRANLGSSGAVKAFIQLLVDGRRREPEVRRNILKVLCLCCHDVLCRRKMKTDNGVSVLVGELRSAEYGVNDPIVKSILSGLMCYYFDDLSLRFMVQKLDLARVLGGRLKELVAAMRATGGGGDFVEVNETHSHVPVNQSTAVAADSHSPDRVDFSCTSSVQGSEPSSSRSTSAESSGSSSRSVTPVEASSDVQVVPVVATFGQTPGSPEWSVPTEIFESMLEDIAMSPPVPHPPRVGVPCGSPEGFVLTPHNIIDHLLTAPSPYSSPSPMVASLQQPDAMVGSPSGASTSDADHPLLALVSRLSFLQDCLPSLAQEDLLIPLIDYLSTAGNSHNSKCFATLTRIFRNHHCLSSCVTAVAAPRVWHLPTGGSELLKSLSSVATTPFGVGILANLLLRGSAKERVAASLSIPFLCPDQKVLHKLLVAYSGFTILSEIILQQDAEAHPFLDTALEALFAIWQTRKLLHTPELGALHSAKDPHLQVACEIVHVAASIHAEENKSLPVLASVPRPPAVVSFHPHEAPSSSETPPCKKARITREIDHGCCYRQTCEMSPPDVTFAVSGSSLSSGKDHADHEESLTAVALFPAHRQVMGGASDVFSALLCGSFREANEDTVRLLDVEPSSFEVLLHHTYGCRDKCKQLSAYTAETAMGDSARYLLSSVLAIADRFMMVELISDSERALSRYVTTESVLELFSLATLHCTKELQRCCIELVFDTGAEFSIELGHKLISEGLMPAALVVFQRLAGLQ